MNADLATTTKEFRDFYQIAVNTDKPRSSAFICGSAVVVVLSSVEKTLWRSVTTPGFSSLRPVPRARRSSPRTSSGPRPPTSRSIRSSSPAVRAPWSRTSTATATSTSWPASPCRPPATTTPRWCQAIKDAADRFLHICGTDFYFEGFSNLAERLAKVAPGKSKKRVFLSNSGTEAVEGAIKLARNHTRRSGLIAFHQSFHGRSYGAMSLTSSKVKQHAHFGPMLPEVYHVPFANPYRLGGAQAAMDLVARRDRRPVHSADPSRRRGGDLRRADPGRGRLRDSARRLSSRHSGSSATSTASCWSSTRSRAAWAAPGRCGPATGKASSPTSW